MSYRLEELGPHEFERLVQVLLLRLYGPTVAVFGSGRDDGRDAAYCGQTAPLNEDAAALAPAWEGYHVFQSKFCEHPAKVSSNRSWLLGQVKSELKAWSARWPEKDGGGRKRKGERPDYYVVVTNVALSGQVGGGIDDVKKEIRDHAADPSREWDLKECDVWDRSKVERLLDAYPDVRQSFNGLLTPGDVLAAMGKMTTIPTEQTVPILDEHARTELAMEGKIALGEAGDLSNQRLDLADVAIDLPAHLADDEDPISSVDVLRHLIETGNRNLRPSVYEGPSPHVLLVGGPGQGKTTLGRILMQTYRAGLLADRPRLSPGVREVVDATSRRATELPLPPVVVRRWPFRVDLAKYGEAIGGGTRIPLIRYITDQINQVTGAEFSPLDARKWFGAWPWLLVLDGYDEVAAPQARDHVARAVAALLELAETEDADLLVVATTRPQGYGDELPPSLRQVELQHLSPAAAARYATKLAQLRMGADTATAEVIERINAAVDNDITGRLMRTPLQVMILSLLLEKRRKPPQDRAALFASYYDVIYDREVQKKNFLADILDNHRQDIDAIHHTVGLALQVRSEQHGDTDALMPASELEDVITQRLTDQEHVGRALDKLVRDLNKAARDRLVLLAATGKEHVGFDLRSLQEYMAARALTSNPDDVVLHNLKALAVSAHWRNTWLLAVGIVYRDKQHLFDRVLQLMDDVDADDDPLSLIAPLGSSLAVDVLDDGMAAHNPRHVRILVRHALRSLTGVNLGAARLGAVLADQPELNDTIRGEIIKALERAQQGPASAQQAAVLVLEELAGPRQTGALALKARQMRSAGNSRRGVQDPAFKRPLVRLADALPDPVNWSEAAQRFHKDLRKVVTSTDEAGVYGIPEGLAPPESTTQAVADPDALAEIAFGIDDIPEHNWSAKTVITSLLWRARARLPVGDALME